MIAVLKMGRGSDVESLEAELAKLRRESTELSTEIERLEILEDEALEASEVSNATGATRAARNRKRKLDAKIDEVLGRLALAKDACRGKQRTEMLDQYSRASGKFLEAARVAQDAFVQAISAREALRMAGFHQEHAALPGPPGIGGSALLAHDLLDRYEADLTSRTHPAPANRRTPTSTPSAAKSADKIADQARHPSRARVKPSEGTDRREPRHEVVRAGEVLVRLLRDGVEWPDGTGGVSGDVISVPVAIADALMFNGAADPVSPPDRGATITVAASVEKEAAE